MLSGDRAALYDKKSTSGIVVDDGVKSAWASARESGNFVACRYDPSVKDRVILLATDAGSYASLKALLDSSPDEVVYGACPFTTGGLRKFFFFTHVGAGVSGMKKARVAMHKGGIYKEFEGVVADVFASDASEFSADAVIAKLKKDGSADASL